MILILHLRCKCNFSYFSIINIVIFHMYNLPYPGPINITCKLGSNYLYWNNVSMFCVSVCGIVACGGFWDKGELLFNSVELVKFTILQVLTLTLL